jgi:hypothetical protein
MFLSVRLSSTRRWGMGFRPVRSAGVKTPEGCELRRRTPLLGLRGMAAQGSYAKFALIFFPGLEKIAAAGGTDC